MLRVARDERERLIDLRGAEIAYMVLGFGVLVAVAVRSLRGDDSIDLLALVALSGVAGQAYVAWRRAFTRRLIAYGALAAAIAAIAGGLTVLLR